MAFTPTFRAADISAVATDIVVGTGASIVPFAPLIGGVVAYKALKRNKGKQSIVGKALGLKFL